jgi:outer membrane protein assembly factor BamE (lipoprotein component of BamABCDE complex)
MIELAYAYEPGDAASQAAGCPELELRRPLTLRRNVLAPVQPLRDYRAGDTMQRNSWGAGKFFAAIVLGFWVSGCSVYMAANQPDKKDVEVLKPGSPRAAVMAEFGVPMTSTIRDGAKVDLYSFTQGYSGIEKGGRAIFHGAADVVTLGLWEIVGTPIEGNVNGTKVTVEVTYDREDRVAKVVPIRGKEALN